MMNFGRRAFLAAPAAALAASDRIRVGVIGTGGRGQYLMKELNRIGGVEFPVVCDVWDERRAQAVKLAGGTAKDTGDYRAVLERKDVDAVIVATPDHWHSAITVEACRAGKDVYCEKPMVHTPEQGLAVVRAARQYKRVVEVGTNARGMTQFLEAKKRYLDTGIVGKVGLVRTWYTSNRGYIQEAPPNITAKPAGLDWEKWCGPGPHVPWNPGIYFSPYKWNHYCGGMAMGIMIHVLDSTHHLLGLKKPKSASAGGGIYFYDDGRDSPDVFTATLDYPEKVTVTFESEVLSAPGVRTTAGVLLRGTGGLLEIERYAQDIGWKYIPNAKFSKEAAAQGPGGSPNAAGILADWLDAIRTRRRPVCNEEDGYYSSVACYMANRAWMTQSRVTWDPNWDLPVNHS